MTGETNGIIRLGKSKIWKCGRGYALHVPKWWVKEYAENLTVAVY